MARIRSLKPEIWEDEALGGCPVGARLLFIGLITQADDEGRLRAGSLLLRSRIFPYDGGSISASRVEEWLAALADAGLVIVYDHEGQRYAELPRWSAHQKISHVAKSKIPEKPLEQAENVNPPKLSGGNRQSSEILRTDHGSRKGSRKGSRIMDQEARDEHAQRIYDQWQTEEGLVKHRALRPDARKAAKTALATHTVDEIVEAVSLYATILTSQNHYWSKSWTLAEFLNRGLDRFLAESAPLERFLRMKQDNPDSNGKVVHRSEAERVAAASATFLRVEEANGYEAAVEWLSATHKPSLCAAVLEAHGVAA